MGIKFNGFDWNQGNEQKCQKHGLIKSEIEAFFLGKLWVAPDVKHSDLEDRYLAVGRSSNGRPMFVAFTLRNYQGEILIRPISARYMHEREVTKYEEAFTKNED
ncbi:BrnT family toxin [Aphanothece sacrum]|uniref:BrnT family toxin n=2 Tax=Aphanothece sacrum TaxID=1122 RepID=A0A401IMW4_APHSA|nr:BrnT family toxin [Aphanothece sacrum]GBF82587.1 hypothetical protein AsFPU1_4017 [Aphanothece sacrum FPU1]GBF84721.1 hypothetical protein AsFPU3_1775 [Aphanothece sacrum FPU3]